MCVWPHRLHCSATAAGTLASAAGLGGLAVSERASERASERFQTLLLLYLCGLSYGEGRVSGDTFPCEIHTVNLHTVSYRQTHAIQRAASASSWAGSPSKRVRALRTTPTHTTCTPLPVSCTRRAYRACLTHSLTGREGCATEAAQTYAAAVRFPHTASPLPVRTHAPHIYSVCSYREGCVQVEAVSKGEPVVPRPR